MKHLRVKFILFVSLIFTNLSFAQVAVIFQPDSNSCQNAVVWDLYPNSPRPNDILFQGSAWTLNGTPEVYRSLVQFNLSSIPSNAIIDSAFLSLYGYVDAWNGHSTLSGSNESVLKRITSAWNENTVTWNTQPSSTSIDQINLPVSNFAGEDYLHYDLKNMVQFWTSNPSGNYGLFYMLQNEQYYRRMSFHSPASIDSAKRPLLNVFYSVSNGIKYLSEDKLQIFPNPSAGKFIVSINDAPQNISFIIFNSYGQEIYHDIFLIPDIKKEIKLTGAAGIYFLKAIAGEKIVIKKLVIEDD